MSFKILCFMLGMLYVSVSAQIYRPAELIQLDEFYRKLKYPEEAKIRGMEGRVLLRVWVNEDSTLSLDRIIKSPDTLFSLEVISGLSNLKALPGMRDGKYIREGITFPVSFTLKNEMSFAGQMSALKWICRPSGLCYAWIDSSGTELLRTNKVAEIHYSGFLENGYMFDTSRKGKGKPFVILVGKTSLIEGWNEALKFIPHGSRAWLKVPPELGYGAEGIGDIPGNSVLYFDMQVLPR